MFGSIFRGEAEDGTVASRPRVSPSGAIRIYIDMLQSQWIPIYMPDAIDEDQIMDWIMMNSGENVRDTIVIRLMRMFMDGPDVSLKGSPTVSPTTAAL